MTDALDWTLPIVIAATDWQGELPARVVSGPDFGGDYGVVIDARLRLNKGGSVHHAGQEWFFDRNGTCIRFPDIRVINKGTGDE